MVSAVIKRYPAEYQAFETSIIADYKAGRVDAATGQRRSGEFFGLLGDRFGLTEGPVWVPDADDGYLLFSDLISNVIYRWAPGEPISVYLDRAGYSGNELAKAGFQTRRGRMARARSAPSST